MTNYSDDPEAPRETKQALWRGWRRVCPVCGEGRLFDGYLTVNQTCPACGSELHHQRADDGPAWATIIIAGHLLAPAMLIVFEAYRPEPWKMALGFSIALVALQLYMLPRIKGMFVGLQWAKRMHGFGRAPVPRKA